MDDQCITLNKRFYNDQCMVKCLFSEGDEGSAGEYAGHDNLT